MDWLRIPRRALALILAVTIASPAVPAERAEASHAARRKCAPSRDASGLNAVFSSDIGPMVGADYQRSFPLPDGRVLWLFQDAFLRTSSGSIRLAHNAGLVQRGRCFRVLHAGSAGNPTSWIGARKTTPERRWFWPLGGTVARDGSFRLFVAEMVELGPNYLSRTAPVATWMATISLPDLRVTRLRPAPDSSWELFGWSVVDGNRYTYLFSHCHRQFGWSAFGFAECASDVKVARVRRGRLNSTPTYWNGREWTTRRQRAVNIAPTTAPSGKSRKVNPMQVAFDGRCWVAVTKEGDWWGDTIYLDTARTPTGPWRTTASIPVSPFGDPNEYNTYFASFIKSNRRTRIIGLSNNRWDGVLSAAYRPTFHTIANSGWRPCGP
jgi:hypothetical protein